MIPILIDMFDSYFAEHTQDKNLDSITRACSFYSFTLRLNNVSPAHFMQVLRLIVPCPTISSNTPHAQQHAGPKTNPNRIKHIFCSNPITISEDFPCFVTKTPITNPIAPSKAFLS